MAATVGGAWSFAVPLDDSRQATGSTRPLPLEHEAGSVTHERAGKANSIQRRPSAWELQSDTETTKTRRSSMRSTSHASAQRKPSRNALRDANKRDQSRRIEGQVDDSAWIHRDKLAQIEIQEMEEAGIPVRQSRRSMSADPEGSHRRSSRSMSRSGSRRPISHDQNEIVHDEDYAAAYPGQHELDRVRASTISAAAVGDMDGADIDNRSPDEPSTGQSHQRHVLRPSTSRIPIATPNMTTSNTLGRDSPNDTRSRSGSGAWSSKWDEIRKEKGRSNSISSNVLLDDAENERITPPSSANKPSSADDNSPPKARVPKKRSPSGRRPSRPGSSHGNKAGARTPSATGRRPGSSSGQKYPEGEPPWLSTMYKPDPRLPPDQQMLPTHAKRMMQEQWEKEGKTGSIYDRQFNLLNDEQPGKPQPDVPTTPSEGANGPVSSNSVPAPLTVFPPPTTNGNNAWSPTSKGDARSDGKSDSGSPRPGTSGGYRITPTIPDTPAIERPAQSPIKTETPIPRIPDLDEKDEAKPKKACCCVMM